MSPGLIRHDPRGLAKKAHLSKPIVSLKQQLGGLKSTNCDEEIVEMHNFRKVFDDLPETLQKLRFHKISAPENQVKLRYLTQLFFFAWCTEREFPK